jgi:galactokinase
MEIADGQTHGLADAERLVALLGALPARADHPACGLFDADGPIVVARAPGRLDVMGGIADYSGSLVLQWPIREAAFAAVQLAAEPVLRIVSDAAAADRRASFEMPLSDFERGGARAIDYDAARADFGREPATQWAAYVAGAFLVLMRERAVRFDRGARILIHSDVPEGKGVSSSAAIELAAMTAVAAAYGLPIVPRELAILCQIVENRVVGAPCGVMDQMTAACGEAGRLLALRCQPAELLTPVEMPDDLALFGIDSGIRHAVSGDDYVSVRLGAFMGYRIIADLAGLRVDPPDAGRGVVVHDDRWGGYLANVTPAEFERDFARRLPERMTGRDFLDRYGGTTDPVTRVDPGRDYAIRQPTAHPIYEHQRVCAFAQCLRRPRAERSLEALGEIMYQSHASYSACGLGSDGTDALVEQVRAAGPGRGLYGAKITGGGSGGTVVVLARRGAEAVVRDVAAAYRARTGRDAYLFSGSSPGAGAFGVLTLRPSRSG